MYIIKLVKRAPGLDDRYIMSMGPRQIRTIGVFEFACYPLRDGMKTFKSPAAALAMLARYGYTDADGNPLARLTAAGVTAVEIIPA